MGANQSDLKEAEDTSRERKRKWWKRRTSKAVDPGKFIREVISTWNFEEIIVLVEEYEKLHVEKDLYIKADSARMNPQNVKADLADLLDFKWNSDINLILPPAIFPAHRAILMQRSKYFRTLLNNNRSVNVNINDLPVDVPTLSALLRYLYTEENSGNLISLANDYGFGLPERLESDLKDLLSTGKYSDVVLLFGDELSFPCHKSILAARSPFFRSLLHRRSNSKKIVLDESILPKRYGRVLLQCMYIDKVDLNLIDPSRTGITEVESLTSTGRVTPAGYEEAMELFQIGRFLEFDMLCQNCEDIIVESLNVDILTTVLSWSKKSHGSQWVRRQALMFLREEFLHIATTPQFLDLDKDTLLEVVSSDFVQAPETEILQSIIRWGENQLIKRVEEREPNLVTQTRDSVSRKGIKRRDMSDTELREIIGELIKCIRIDQLNCESFQSLVRRGLISLPPLQLLTEDNNRHKFGHTRVRLYSAFYEEIKLTLRNRNIDTIAKQRLQRIIPPPDTLYMTHEERPSFSVEAQIVIDAEVLNAMLYREKKLRNNCKYLTSQSVSKYIRLRVVREFGFPDSVAENLIDHHGRAGSRELREQNEDSNLSERMPDVAIAAHDLKSICLDDRNVDIVDLDLGDRQTNFQSSSSHSTLASTSSQFRTLQDHPGGDPGGSVSQNNRVVRYNSYTNINVGPPHYL